jgi:hypothetical protein
MDSIEPPRNGLQVAKSTLLGKADHTGGDILVLREQAKDALRSLVPHNIRYNELLGEGVDPYLLRDLYEDLDQNAVKAKLFPTDTEVEMVSKSQKVDLKRPQHAQDLSAEHLIADVSQNLPQAGNTTGASANLATVSDVAKSQANASRPASKASIVASTNIENATVAPPSLSVAMERKDRIAQLLAAKTGKTIPPRIASEKQPDIPAQSPKPDPPVQPAQKAPTLPEKPPLPSPDPVVKIKNKAQTDLIRQKMEALKKEALAKAQAQGKAKEETSRSSPASPVPLDAIQPQQSRRSGSTTIIPPNGGVSQIPGLFMTSLAQHDDFDNAKETIQPLSVEKVVDPIAMDSTTASYSQSNSAEFENEPLELPGGHLLPVRVPQKRPLASDSFDEAMPPLKRPFGREDSYDEVEIIISDAESEGEVEDVEMELDEESDEEKQSPQLETELLVSLPESNSNIRNLSPLIDNPRLPSPKPVVYSISGIGTPNSSAVQTPGLEKDKEDLWKAKHQEIELMRKKIAEMEERRKAKQNATLVISPKVATRAAQPLIRTSLARPSQTTDSGFANAPTPMRPGPSSGVLQSPVLTPSRPEELPATPSTPLSAIKEPVKAEDLRHNLLRRKPTREGTPSVAEIELRKAQLAEKRAKLAELKREAERREAEILEESKMLEEQFEAEISYAETYSEGLSNMNGNVECGSTTMDQTASDVPPHRHEAAQGADIGGTPSATGGSHPSQPERPLDSTTPEVSSANHDLVLQSSVEDEVDWKMAAFEPRMTSPKNDISAIPDIAEGGRNGLAEQHIEMLRSPQRDCSPPVPLSESGPLDTESPQLFNADNIAQDRRHEIPGFDLLDEDGSVSMSDSASEDYEPAEPGQTNDARSDKDSEIYEPADVATPVDAVQQLEPKEDDITEPITVEPPVTGSLPNTIMAPVTKMQAPPILIDDREDGMQLTEPDVVNQLQMISQPHDNDGESYDKVSASALNDSSF